MPPDWRGDPRPDIIADHALWQQLLRRIDDPELGWLLNGARCAGTMIAWADGEPKLRPLIDPARGFASAEAWHDFRDRWLRPRAADIAQALSMLTRLGSQASA
jgi:hypothetical protein